MDDLNFNAAGRITSYSTSGLVETWKLGLTSQVNEDIRVRSTLSFDIRAPDLAELFNVIPASGGQVDYLTGNTAAAALSMAAGNTVRSEKTYHFNVFQQQKWTPYLMMMTLYNSISGINESMDEATYRLTGTANLTNGQGKLDLTTMQTSGEMPMPAPMTTEVQVSISGMPGPPFGPS